MSSDLFAGPSATTSLPPLFSGPSNGYGSSGPGPSVYYYVLLGVLVTLILIAGSLTYRTYRLRRRYRTAQQLAIARGDPVPPPDWWGRVRNPEPWAGVRRTTRRRKWVRIPTMWDAVTDENEKAPVEDEDGFIGQPLSLQSQLPGEELQPPPQQAAAPPRAFRGGGMRSYWSMEEDRRNRERAEEIPPVSNPVEQDVTPGEPVRLAFMVQMPVQGKAPSTRTEASEEDVGWRPGMEIGVWEGVVDQRTRYSGHEHLGHDLSEREAWDRGAHRRSEGEL